MLKLKGFNECMKIFIVIYQWKIFFELLIKVEKHATYQKKKHPRLCHEISLTLFKLKRYKSLCLSARVERKKLWHTKNIKLRQEKKSFSALADFDFVSTFTWKFPFYTFFFSSVLPFFFFVSWEFERKLKFVRSLLEGVKGFSVFNHDFSKFSTFLCNLRWTFEINNLSKFSIIFYEI